MRGTWNTTRIGKIPSLLFWQRGAHHHRSQTTCVHVQKGCNYGVVMSSGSYFFCMAEYTIIVTKMYELV